MRPAGSAANLTRPIFYDTPAAVDRNCLSFGMSGSRLIYNIKQLVNTRREARLLRGAELADLPCTADAWVLTEGDRIAECGPMTAMPDRLRRWIAGEGRIHGGDDESRWESRLIDATGRFVLPAWCDSHTHLVFAGSREAEFVDKIRGLSYAEIAARGGGILHSARELAGTSEDRL